MCVVLLSLTTSWGPVGRSTSSSGVPPHSLLTVIIPSDRTSSSSNISATDKNTQVHPIKRVKSVDFHPTEPWLLAGLYSGKVFVWHTETGALLKTFTPTEVPVRCARFIARKNWFVCGSDDFHLRVFNYNTSARVAAFEAHPDYIRLAIVLFQYGCQRVSAFSVN
ncbi:hypothetical protein PGTUg99_000289 [Puccinia graminis f. sp. tritici]|uniref:Uncharacterized protein n=1 Tax=Puccinia graminis f. sp. tritici TaxID=56615 RepID=A0A5B0NVV5_PUCGR|nr:hypothetical protein PGTUg99_000289 [Puccinia graminis f. sp. tritici]